MKIQNTKKSGLELMRIISMFFIVVFHIILHSNFIIICEGKTKFLLVLIEAFMYVHVNSFILLTGYFQSDKDAKLSKVISIINSTWFYKLLCFAGIIFLTRYLSLPNNVPLTFHQKLISILPLDRNENWYINCFLLIYIFSPFLNIIINKLDQKKLKKLIILMFVIFSILGNILFGPLIPIYGEASRIFNFIIIYFIGAYLRKYPIEESRLFSTYTPKMRKYIFLGIYIVLSIISMSFRITSIYMEGICSELSYVFYMASISFISPIIIIQSVAYFLFFKNMTFNSKVINYISGTTFGIYLFHENIYVRENLYNWLGLTKYSNSGWRLILIILVLGVIIFISCMIVEIIRKLIYKFFYKRKFALKLRNKLKAFIDSLGLDINY